MSRNPIEVRLSIRENITPRGDGNCIVSQLYINATIYYKREYNSERRRKLLGALLVLGLVACDKREYNSERRRKH